VPIFEILHPFNGPFSETTRVSRYPTGKTNLDFTEARDSEWQWHQMDHMQVCTSLQIDNHASTPPLSFFTGRMPFLPPNQQCQSTEGTIFQFLRYANNILITNIHCTHNHLLLVLWYCCEWYTEGHLSLKYIIPESSKIIPGKPVHSRLVLQEACKTGRSSKCQICQKKTKIISQLETIS